MMFMKVPQPPLRTLLINEERDSVAWPPVLCPASPFFLTTSEVGADSLFHGAFLYPASSL